jgi:hypothetical protein
MWKAVAADDVLLKPAYDKFHLPRIPVLECFVLKRGSEGVSEYVAIVFRA